MSDFARKLLADSFGIAMNDPRMDQIMETLELARRDKQIYELSGKVETADIAVRFGVSQRHCERIVKDQLALRRTG